MNDDMQLHIDITGDSAQAVTSIDAVNARLGALETAFNRSGGAADGSDSAFVALTGSLTRLDGTIGTLNTTLVRMLEAMPRAASSVRTVGESAGVTTKFLSDMNEAGGASARMFSAVGVEAGAAAGRIGAFAGAIGSMASLSGPILGIVAAFSALAATVGFFKQGIDSAAQMQRSMEQLRGVAEANGQAWDTLSGKVENFFDVESMASGFSREELAQSLQDLTARLGNVGSAMEAMRITEELARGTGMDLATSERTLTELLGGRYMALERLDPKIKEMVKDHKSTRDILIELHTHFRNAIQDSDDLATMTDREKVAHEKAAEALGVVLIPQLLSLDKTMIGAWENMADFAKDWGIMWQGMAMVVSGAIGQMKSDMLANAKVFEDFVTGNFGAIGKDYNSAGSHGFDTMHTGMQIIASGSQALDQRPDAYKRGNDAVYEAIRKHDADLIKQIDSLNSLPAASEGRGGTSSTQALQAVQARKNATADLAEQIRTLSEEYKHGKITLDQYDAALNSIANAHYLDHALVDNIRDIERAAAAATGKVKSFKDVLYSTRSAVPDLMRQENEALSQTPELLNKVTETSLNWIRAQSDAALEQMKNLKEQQQAWDAYYKTLEENAKQWTDKTAGWIDEMFSHGAKGVNGFAETFKKMLKEIEEALLKSALFELFMGAQGAKGQSFLSVFAQNMGFGSKSSTASSSPINSAIPILSMAAGSAGPAVSGIAGMFGAHPSNASVNGSGGIIGALVGTSTATQLASSLPTDSLMSLMFGVGAPSVAGGLGGSGGSGGNALSGVPMIIAGSGGPGGGTLAGALSGGSELSNLLNLGGMKGGIGGISALLGTHLGTFGGSTGFFSGMGSLGTLGSGLLGAAGGYGIGTIIDHSLFGNQPLNHGGAMGGALGGGLGSIFGPALDAALGIGTGGIGLILGPLLGALGGSVLGGLFGNHDNPANMPDKYDTKRYGTIVSDLIGNAGAQGQHFTEQSQLSSASGGRTGISWIEQTLAQYANPDGSPKANTPDWLKSQWGQLVGAFGISASGSGKLNFGHAVNNEWITGAQGVTSNSGKPMQYTQLGALLDTFYQNFITQGQVGITNPAGPNAPGNANGGGFNVNSPFAGAYVVGTPGSTPKLVSGAPSFAMGADPNAVTTGSLTLPHIINHGTPARHTLDSLRGSDLRRLRGTPTYSLSTDPMSTGENLPHSRVHLPFEHVKADGGTGGGFGGALGKVLGGITIHVNVAGNVTAEHDLAQTIHDKIIDGVTRSPFSNNMALRGFGL